MKHKFLLHRGNVVIVDVLPRVELVADGWRLARHKVAFRIGQIFGSFFLAGQAAKELADATEKFIEAFKACGVDPDEE